MPASPFAATPAFWRARASGKRPLLRRRRRNVLERPDDREFRRGHPARPKGSSARDRVSKASSASKNTACRGESHGPHAPRSTAPPPLLPSPRKQATPIGLLL